MQVPAPCSLCGEAGTVFTCQRCGVFVGKECFVPQMGLCVRCSSEMTRTRI